MKENNDNFNIFTFAKEKIQSFFNGDVNNIIKWGENNTLPEYLLTYFDTIPEHSSALLFIQDLVVGEGIDKDSIDIWTLKRIVLDYILFGSFVLLRQGKINGQTVKLEWLDMAKCRLSKDERYIVYHKRNLITNILEKTSYPLIEDSKSSGVYFFKNPMSRDYYGRPQYLSSIRTLDTMNNVIVFNQDQSANGFAPSVIINIPEEGDFDRKSSFEKAFKDKFIGTTGQKFMTYFNSNPDNKLAVETIDNAKFDESFEILYKTLRNQIVISHRMTSGQLIGLPNEGSGFNKQEYDESLTIFKDVVINGIRNELEYGLSKFFGTEIKFVDTQVVSNVTQSETNKQNNILTEQQ